MSTLLSPGQFLEQYKKLPNLLDGDDITEGGIWWGWLARGEWEFLYSLSFAMEGAGVAARTESLNTLMIAAGRYVEERGFKFRGCRFTESRRVLRRQHGLIEPRNGLFMYMLQSGKVPDYVTHMSRALFMCENRFKDENLRDMLRAAQADLESTVKTIPEAPKDFKEAVRERVAKMKELAKRFGVDLSQPGAVESVMRADAANNRTLEEELEN